MAHLRLSFLVTLGAVAFSVAGCGESHMGTQDAGGSDARLGADAFRPGDGAISDDTMSIDDAPHLDGGAASCAADDARAITCPIALCDGPDSYAWDGDRCVRIDCGACEGADCGALTHSPGGCEAAHAGCEPALCRTTGGDWLFFTEECFHYECGRSLPSPCLVGRPVCNCGDGRSWVDGIGCADDPTCPEVDPLPSDVLCGSTGGTWTDGICCSTRCGVACGDDCAAPACVCGAMEVFDTLRGCVPGTECFEREAGETCGFLRTRCDAGLICCQHCSGVGCAPDMTCEAPVCDAEPAVDECGNNIFVP